MIRTELKGPRAEARNSGLGTQHCARQPRGSDPVRCLQLVLIAMVAVLVGVLFLLTH